MKYLALIPTSQRLCDYQFWQESHRRKQILNRYREHNFTTGIALNRRAHRYAISEANYTQRIVQPTGGFVTRLRATPQGTGELWKFVSYMGAGTAAATVRLLIDGVVVPAAAAVVTVSAPWTYEPAIGTHPFNPASTHVYEVEFNSASANQAALFCIRLLFRTQLTTD